MASNYIGNQRGSGFTNIQNYLDANSNNVLGSNLSNKIGQTTSGLKDDLNNSYNDFQTDANNAQLNNPANTQAVTDLTNKVSGITAGNSLSDQDVSNYNTLSSGQYTGPDDLNNIDSLKGRASEATQIGKSISDPNSRFSLLRNYMGNPDYSYGQQRLDNLFLNNNDDLNSIRKSTSGVGQAVDATESQAAALKSGVVAANQAFGQQTQGAVQGVNDTLATNLQNQYNTNLNNYNDATTKFNNNQITPELAQQLGLNYGQRIYDINLGDYATGNAPTVDSGATADQRSQIAALQQLIGSGATQLANPLGTQTYDPTRPLTINTDALNQQISNRDTAYQNDTKIAQQNAVSKADDPYQSAALNSFVQANQASGIAIPQGESLQGLSDLYTRMLSGPEAQGHPELQQKIQGLLQQVQGYMSQAQSAAIAGLNQSSQYNRTIGQPATAPDKSIGQVNR